ncbi:hypothetical protein FPQ18DRAFT_391660 [Pyronema domesticum]|nr:hypothetical protein FPQ18DRAFT_391660 [Pyronema domesticum]
MIKYGRLHWVLAIKRSRSNKVLEVQGDSGSFETKITAMKADRPVTSAKWRQYHMTAKKALAKMKKDLNDIVMLKSLRTRYGPYGFTQNTPSDEATNSIRTRTFSVVYAHWFSVSFWNPTRDNIQLWTPKLFQEDYALLQMNPRTSKSGTVLSSTNYVWHENIKATIKTARGAGVVTAFILMSNVEIRLIASYIAQQFLDCELPLEQLPQPNSPSKAKNI